MRSREVIVGDFNGDGRKDIAVPPDVAGASGTWQICLSTGTAFQCSNWTGVGATRKANYYTVGDFDGDGRDDIAVYASAMLTTDYLCKSTGSSFAGGCTPYLGVYSLLAVEAENPARQFSNASDANGDGRTDVLKITASATNPNLKPTMTVYRATDSGFIAGMSAQGAGPGASISIQSIPGLTRFGDQTGDPVDSYGDILLGFPTAIPPVTQRCVSTGSALSCTTTTAASASQATVSHVGDFDGDGYLDAQTGAGICQINSAGGLFNCVPWAAAPATPGALAVIYADFNGDGIIDSATYSSTTSNWTVNLGGHGGYPDLLASVTNGVGHVTQFDYKGMNDASVYTKGADVAFPVRNITGSSPLVSQMRVANAVGGWFVTDYRYEASRTHVQGRGPLGFQKFTSVDQVNGITTVTTYEQSFPNTGAVVSVTATQTNGVVLRSATNSLASFSTAAGSVFPYVASSTAIAQDLNGGAISVSGQ